MKGLKALIAASLLLVFCIQSLYAQSIRAAYSYQAKRSEDGNFWRPNIMMTEYDGSKAVYYCDASFYVDSLRRIAFDDTGEVCDQKAYNEIFDYTGGLKDIVFTDYQKQSFTLEYHHGLVYITGTDGVLTLPEWEISDETKTTEEGFSVRKATADYMGRKWTIWYCTDIPYPTGPWLFWGAPGLIAEANDEDNLFSFKLLHVAEISPEEIRADKLYFYRHNLRGHRKQYTYPVKEAEKVYTKVSRDSKYANELSGMGSAKMMIQGKDGVYRPAPTEHPYIPLIAETYWE